MSVSCPCTFSRVGARLCFLYHFAWIAPIELRAASADSADGALPCAMANLVPVEAAAVREARERLGSLVDIAALTFDRVFNAIGRAGCCLLLTDSR